MQTTSIKLILAALAASAALALAGCGQNDDSHGSSDYGSHSMMDEAAESASHGNGHDGHMGDHHEAGAHTEKKPADARAVTITATDFAFDPATITAAPGEQLFITLVNKGNAVHMWQLKDYPETHLHTPIGETAAKTIVAPMKPGVYKIICSTPGHEQLGMVGKLEVRSDSDTESGGLHPPMLTPSPDDSEHSHAH